MWGVYSLLWDTVSICLYIYLSVCLSICLSVSTFDLCVVSQQLQLANMTDEGMEDEHLNQLLNKVLLKRETEEM